MTIDSPPHLIDINVSYGAWPFQRFRHTTLAELSGLLRAEGIEQAFVSHVGGVFHPDPDPYNLELIEEASRLDGIVPVPVINPAFPGWRQRLDNYLSLIELRAVKLHPNYHRYRLDSEEVASLVRYLCEIDIPLFLQMRMEDERMRYAGLDVVGLSVDDIVAFHNRHPDLLLVCLNAYLPEARRIGREAQGVFVDTAFTEWMFTMELMLEDLPPERILFGSHAPFLYIKAGADKLVKAPIEAGIKQQIGHRNAQRLFIYRKKEA